MKPFLDLFLLINTFLRIFQTSKGNGNLEDFFYIRISRSRVAVKWGGVHGTRKQLKIREWKTRHAVLDQD